MSVGVGDPAFDEREGALFARYIRHMSAAMRIGRYVDRLRSEASAGGVLMDAAGQPMILVDAGLAIHSANRLAEELLASGGELRRGSGRLVCRHRDNAERLERAVHSLAEATTRSRAAVRLEKTAGRPVLCALSSMRPELTMSAFGRAPTVLVFIVDANDEGPDPEFVGSMFELTPAEALVAAALCRGHTLNMIAAARRVSVETVRSQVRSIYAKTDTNRRAQLVALLSRLVPLDRRGTRPARIGAEATSRLNSSTRSWQRPTCRTVVLARPAARQPHAPAQRLPYVGVAVAQVSEPGPRVRGARLHQSCCANQRARRARRSC